MFTLKIPEKESNLTVGHIFLGLVETTNYIGNLCFLRTTQDLAESETNFKSIFSTHTHTHTPLKDKTFLANKKTKEFTNGSNTNSWIVRPLDEVRYLPSVS